jgi:hypothetical protein
LSVGALALPPEAAVEASPAFSVAASVLPGGLARRVLDLLRRLLERVAEAGVRRGGGDQ